LRLEFTPLATVTCVDASALRYTKLTGAIGFLRVSELMTKTVFSVDSSASVYDVVREMLNRDIGCIVVLSKGEVVGVVTKGDVLRETIMKKADPTRESAGEIMSRPVVKIGDDASVEEATSLMSKYSVSKLPVVDDGGRLVGIVTSTDLLRKSGRRKIAEDQI